ncbi:HMG box protein [Xylariales sp. AK1849]|nr:HMG box protein [Xylariales sp. AK1849]
MCYEHLKEIHSQRGRTGLMNPLEQIFGELGISQYLEEFVDQGFDSWETILDITESDLDALGVKLGHRRKLQRRIANHRGLASVAVLLSPTRSSIEDPSANASQTTLHTETKERTAASAKRKYRRHPKPDQNAPERPPSAYVLFSNKMREDLKGQNLTFTEIAKLVGENWQNLDRSEKEPYESQASDAKERYNRDMNDYKKTADYKQYCDYLQDFRKRQANQEKDASKRLKTDGDSSSNRGSSTSAASLSNSYGNSNASHSDSQPGSEPPPTRQQKLSSVMPRNDSRVSPVLSPHGFQLLPDDTSQSAITAFSPDESVAGRARAFSNSSNRDSSDRRHPGLHEGQRLDGPSIFGLPPISNPGDSRGGIKGTGPPSLIHSSSTRGSGSSPFWSGPPSLQTEKSAGSVSSLSSYLPPRTPSDSTLPIYSLLSSEPVAPMPHVAPLHDDLASSNPQSSTHQHPGRPPGDLGADTSSPYSHDASKISLSTAGLRQPPLGSFPLPTTLPPVVPVRPPLAILHDRGSPALPNRGAAGDHGLDGMSALLRASDIVDRHNH